MSGTCRCGDAATCIARYEVSVGPFIFGCDTCCGHGNEDGQCVQLKDHVAVLGLVNQLSFMHDNEMFDATAAISERDALTSELAEARRMLVDVRKLLRECPLGYADGALIHHRSTTAADVVAWLRRASEAETTIRAALAGGAFVPGKGGGETLK